MATPHFLRVDLQQRLCQAGLISEADPQRPWLEQSRCPSHSFPTVPAIPALTVKGPNPLNVSLTLRDTAAQMGSRLLLQLTFSRGNRCPTFFKGWGNTFASTQVSLGGCGCRYGDIHGPKWLCECGEAVSIFLPSASCITLKM